MNIKLIKIVAFSFLALIVITVISVVTIYFMRAGKYLVEIDVLPTEATIVIDDKQQTPGSVYLKSGSYSWSVDKKGFAKEEGTLIVTENVNNNHIIASLQPLSLDARKWISSNEELYKEFEERASERAVKEGSSFSTKHPITEELPFSNFLYSIGYRLNYSDPSGDSIIVEIDATEGYRNAAIQKIRDLGYDPSDFTINFRGYTNPFL